MKTTKTYTLNSTTAHDLREGDTLTHKSGGAYTVRTILPFYFGNTPTPRGYRITVIDEYGRPLYLEKASSFYGFEVTHAEETDLKTN